MRFTLVSVALAASISLPACSEPPASEAELVQMCVHLCALRREKPDPDAVKTCVTEAKTEGVSGRQARCRISAVNKTEYWVRCRTGEARKP